jgi:hypothetical protein
MTVNLVGAQPVQRLHPWVAQHLADLSENERRQRNDMVRMFGKGIN